MAFIDELTKDQVYKALQESLELQKHYAILLNAFDGGIRKIFTTPEEWITRLKELNKL